MEKAIGRQAPRLEGCIYKPGNGKDGQQLPETKRGKERFLPQSLQREHDLDFGLVASKTLQEKNLLF